MKLVENGIHVEGLSEPSMLLSVLLWIIFVATAVAVVFVVLSLTHQVICNS
jgi:hypothetical protein